MKLTANVHLYTVKIDSKLVSVVQDNQEIEQGSIEDITDISIKVNGSWFFRDVCEFYLV